MKVMCIDDNYKEICGQEPSFGEIVTATQCDTYLDCYDIHEYLKSKNGIPQSFLKKRFAPISEIEETELVKERELINV